MFIFFNLPYKNRTTLIMRGLEDLISEINIQNENVKLFKNKKNTHYPKTSLTKFLIICMVLHSISDIPQNAYVDYSQNKK